MNWLESFFYIFFFLEVFIKFLRVPSVGCWAWLINWGLHDDVFQMNEIKEDFFKSRIIMKDAGIFWNFQKFYNFEEFSHIFSSKILNFVKTPNFVETPNFLKHSYFLKHSEFSDFYKCSKMWKTFWISKNSRISQEFIKFWFVLILTKFLKI